MHPLVRGSYLVVKKEAGRVVVVVEGKAKSGRKEEDDEDPPPPPPLPPSALTYAGTLSCMKAHTDGRRLVTHSHWAVQGVVTRISCARISAIRLKADGPGEAAPE